PEEGSLAELDVHPHLGLLALAADAEADGHRVRIYDPKRLIRDGTLAYDATLYERASREILAERPVVVGFTALGCSFLF
ncbi:radical SAM protein, partial [Burkholderia pseudomallei]